MIRRLLIHPDVAAHPRGGRRPRRRAAGRGSPAAHRAQRSAVRERAARRGGAGLRRRAARPAAQGERAARAGDPGDGRQGGRHVGRLPAARRRRLRALLRRHAPAPRGAGDVRLRSARAQPRGDPDRAGGRLPRLLRHDHRARPAAAGARRDAGGRGPRRRHDRLVGQRRRAVRRDAPPGARGQPQDLQGARAPAHARDPGDAGRGRRAATSSCASSRSRRRCRAGSWPPASSSCRPRSTKLPS